MMIKYIHLERRRRKKRKNETKRVMQILLALLSLHICSFSSSSSSSSIFFQIRYSIVNNRVHEKILSASMTSVAVANGCLPSEKNNDHRRKNNYQSSLSNAQTVRRSTAFLFHRHAHCYQLKSFFFSLFLSFSLDARIVLLVSRARKRNSTCQRRGYYCNLY